MKAIASGNPAFLTLAEADAEIQRLNILRRSHADEQFLGRRNLRELPDRIERQAQRVAGLAKDQATLNANDDIIIGVRATGDPVLALGNRLDSLPLLVSQRQSIPLGVYRGLRFGMVLNPQWAPEVFLEGAIFRKETLSRDHQGPRAVLNAAERLAKGYGAECERAREDLEVAQRQLRDYQARVGQAFAQDHYLTELAALRDKLKLGLSEAGTKEGEPTVAELAEQIKALKGENGVDAAQQRTEKRQVSAEEPVTARILRREQPGEWLRRMSEGAERKTERG